MGKRKSKVAKVHYVDNAVFLEAMIEYKKWSFSLSENSELTIILLFESFEQICSSSFNSSIGRISISKL